MNVRQVIIESIMECSYLKLDSSDINDSMNMKEELGFDSILYIQVIVTIEEKLNMTFSYDLLEMDDIVTFFDFYSRVKKYVEEVERDNK